MPLNINYWILQTFAMLLTCFLLPGLTVHGPLPALMTVLALAYVNAHYWDANLFASIPQVASYSTIILLLANGIIFWFVVKVLPGIEIRGILPAILAPLVFTGTSMLISTYGKDFEWQKALSVVEQTVDYFKQQVIAPSHEGEHAPNTKAHKPHH